jgi:hypothetical protein
MHANRVASTSSCLVSYSSEKRHALARRTEHVIISCRPGYTCNLALAFCSCPISEDVSGRGQALLERPRTLPAFLIDPERQRSGVLLSVQTDPRADASTVAVHHRRNVICDKTICFRRPCSKLSCLITRLLGKSDVTGPCGGKWRFCGSLEHGPVYWGSIMVYS